MEKKMLAKKPYELRGLYNESYYCDVIQTDMDSTIQLENRVTGDKWSCRVTSRNIDSFCRKDTELRFEGLRYVVIGLLQEVLNGTLEPLPSSFAPNMDWCSLRLKQKNALYFMKLKLECQIGGTRGSWSFPMNPEDPGSIQNRGRITTIC